MEIAIYDNLIIKIIATKLFMKRLQISALLILSGG